MLHVDGTLFQGRRFTFAFCGWLFGFFATLDKLGAVRVHLRRVSGKPTREIDTRCRAAPEQDHSRD